MVLTCLNGPAAVAPTPGAATANAAVPAPYTANYERPVSLKMMFCNVVSDQKHIWLFPQRLARGQDLIPTALTVGATAGLIAIDPREGRYFRQTNSFYRFNQIFGSSNTLLGTLVVPLTMYGAGLLRHDSKMKKTALLAGEAIANTELLVGATKDIDRRLRPNDVAYNGNYANTWFKDPHGGSFPSGHSAAAFAVATVLARRYGNHKWVPYVAYGLAATVGFSRMTLSSHFASDVFMGGVLGYSVGRFTVLRQ